MTNGFHMFSTRAEAGRLLGERLAEMQLENPVVFALPRGGIPIGVEVARRLKAPLDLVLVRKIGAPGNPEVALGAVVEGNPPQTVINPDVQRLSGADQAYIDRVRSEKLAELETRRQLYLGSRPPVDVTGRTAVVVDDGLATGATMKAALIALRERGASRIVIALPVAPESALAEMSRLADDTICLHPARDFRGVGAFYRDFHQLTDEEAIGLLREAWANEAAGAGGDDGYFRRAVNIPPVGLPGELIVPPDPRGVVMFVHGSGSSRLSPRNRFVAERLNRAGFATLLFDLLTEDEAQDRANVFDIPLLTERVVEASLWLMAEPEVAELPLGLFGASTGAAAALQAAAELGGRVSAVVSRGGRPDLAMDYLGQVTAPTLLIVGANDTQVIALNRQAHAALAGEKLLRLVPGASHLFEEPGTLEQATDLARAWFAHYLAHPTEAASPAPVPAPAKPQSPVTLLKEAAIALPPLDSPDFARAFDRFGDKRVVLLGEASHGTSEFYRARAAITRHLVENHGFNIVATEADWPDMAAVNRDIRQHPAHTEKQEIFTRFPTWMWRNAEFDAFVRDLRRINAARADKDQVSLYGLDLYSMNTSIAEVLKYLDRVDTDAAKLARARYACLAPWSNEPAAYGRAALTRGYAICEEPVIRILMDLLERRLEYSAQDGDDFFDAAQNARIVSNAERYYRLMYYGSHVSWNLRDQHMFGTLQNILGHKGPDAKAVVWAHNSHIGDARFTDMGQEREELNIGQLVRQEYGDDSALIGFGTHTGTVAAASEWDAPMEVKKVLPSRPDSYEHLCHAT
ncbi:MAG TPA: erythromycin esterase, partial [Aliiroseovarius sp.]|nr:erythromycin esterase [Aliiroseovarius sp.]